MILYLDTSALVKLYADEIGTEIIKRAVEDASVSAVCEIAYVELRAGLARQKRQGALNANEHRRAMKQFEMDWLENFFRIAPTVDLIKIAGKFAEQFSLRADDAVHLSAAFALKQQVREPVTFACWDVALSATAGKAGIGLLAIR